MAAFGGEEDMVLGLSAERQVGMSDGLTLLIL
jgi:hypothetical protein